MAIATIGSVGRCLRQGLELRDRYIVSDKTCMGAVFGYTMPWVIARDDLDDQMDTDRLGKTRRQGDDQRTGVRYAHVAPRRRRVHSTKCLIHVILFCVIVQIAGSHNAPAQRRAVRGVQPRVIQANIKRPAKPLRAIVIEPTAPIANLLTRAEEGVSRRDWKFAIDCLQRVIDNPQDSLLTRHQPDSVGIDHFESARRKAVRTLASLPPEALRSYRRLFDGKAKRLFQQGVNNHDAAPLRKLVHRYAMTNYGTNAIDLLLSWALDEGRLDEALLLADVLPNIESPPPPWIQVKLAAAHALLGRSGDAHALLATGEEGIDKDVDSALQSTIAAIEHWSSADYSVQERQSTWPVAGGHSARRGLMAAVNPTLSELVPWSFQLPGTTTETWRPALDDLSDGSRQLPIGHLVSDGKLLFARTRRGCVALRPNDLGLVWEVSERAHPIRRTAQSFRGARQEPTTPTTDAGLSLTDRVAGGISIGHDLVYLVTREGRGTYTQDQRDITKRGLLDWIPRPNLGARNESGTRLAAYRLGKGTLAWQRGRTTRHDDPLGDVEFLSVPLAINGALWVPYRQQQGLHIAILDPIDGALRRSVRLISIDAGVNSALDGIQLAASDGMVFVPTERNILLAVDAYDFSVRWAVRYDAAFTDTGSAAPDHPTGWQPGPPVVAGGLVLVAPKGRSELLAFSIVDGTLVWSTFCPDSAYVIAADHQRVWLGGRDISCLAISDGKYLWTTPTDSPPTGQAVRSRDRIQVPTLSELVSMDARTGDVIDRAPVAMGHGAIGNVLCFGTSLYSISPSSIRRYPDLELSYAAALAESHNQPQDATAVIKLAWLELLRDKPQAAFDAVDTISIGSLDGEVGSRGDHEKLALDLAHLRVEALLAMVAQADASEDRATRILELLEDAESTARTPQDRLRCTLAIADQLQTLGRVDDAFDRLWRLGLSRDGAQKTSWINLVEGTARSAVAMRLRKIGRQLDAGVFEAFQNEARIALELPAGQLGGRAVTHEQRERLHAVAELGVPESLAWRALLELGLYQANQNAFESAEQLFLECLRRAPAAPLEIAARMGLCQLYATSAESGFSPPDKFVAQLRQLDDRFGGTTIPQLAGSCADLGAMGGKSETVSDWIRGIRAYHPDLAPIESPKHMSMADASFSDEVLWSVEPVIARGDPPRVVEFGGAPPLQTRNDIVVHSPGDTITSYRVNDGTILWKTALRLPGSFDDRIIVQWRPEEHGTRRAVVDGETLVFNGRAGLFAIGRYTGRRLWCRAHEPKDRPIAPPEADTAMAAEGGLLAAMPRAGRLALMRMSDGATIWERDLLGESVGYMWMTDDHVVSANPRLQRVHVFAKSDGRLLTRILFDQPDPHNRLVELIRTENTICGPYANSNEKGIAAIDLTTGETVWRSPVDKPLMQLFRAQGGFLGLGLLGGDVRIVEALTGRVVLERRVKGAQSVARGILIDGTLLVQPNDTKGGVRTTSLIALDIATDSELWRREDVVPLWRMDRPLHVIDGQLPVLVQSGRRDARRERSINLAMLDIRTGLGSDTKIVLPSTRGPAQLNGDFEWMQQAGVAVIGTETGVRVLKTVSSRKSEEEGL